MWNNASGENSSIPNVVHQANVNSEQKNTVYIEIIGKNHEARHRNNHISHSAIKQKLNYLHVFGDCNTGTQVSKLNNKLCHTNTILMDYGTYVQKKNENYSSQQYSC